MGTGPRIVLLPERRRFGDRRLEPAVARSLARADQLANGEPGFQAQLQRHYTLVPNAWPMAAIQREADAGDAGDARWLRADPVHVQPDISGARLLAWANLRLEPDEADALVSTLQPLFGDAGLPLSRTAPERWYLQLTGETPVPNFSTPEQGLGDDLFRHLPEGPEGRRWRALLNEAQILLHNHAVNEARARAGRPVANSVWFWGAGTLPARVGGPAGAVFSQDAELRALAVLAGQGVAEESAESDLLDLRAARDWPALQRDLLADALAGVVPGRPLLLDFADGARFRIESRHRWRFWRRMPARLDA